jgi:hypothetical protein
MEVQCYSFGTSYKGASHAPEVRGHVGHIVPEFTRGAVHIGPVIREPSSHVIPESL